MSRDVQQAARRLMQADGEELAVILRHDPDMIRDVAQAAVRPLWRKHDLSCSTNDSEFGTCSCGTDHAVDLEFKADIAKRRFG